MCECCETDYSASEFHLFLMYKCLDELGLDMIRLLDFYTCIYCHSMVI
jgi:hypothetical protein